jgi:DNA-binding transcriptional regulator YdaS (Cro superfamily)
MKCHALVVLAGCSWTGVSGSGNARTEVRNVPAFSAIDIAGPIDAEIAIGPESHVEITGDDNIIPLITTDVHGDRLELGARKSVRPSVHLAARITVPRLTRLELTGSGEVAAHGVQADRLAVTLSGSGTIRADGTAHEAEIALVGSGAIALDQLAAERASVSVSGSGDVAVAAARALDVAITGSGDVTYRGEPELRQRITGSGRVTRR